MSKGKIAFSFVRSFILEMSAAEKGGAERANLSPWRLQPMFALPPSWPGGDDADADTAAGRSNF